MNREEFLKQMIAFGQELLVQERKPKINTEFRDNLEVILDSLNEAINTASVLESLFSLANDKRELKISKAVSLIMKVQELLISLAEDEDINLEIP